MLTRTQSPAWSSRAIYVCSLVLILALSVVSSQPPATVSQGRPAKIIVSVDSRHPANRFMPSHAFGGAIDGHEKGELDRMLSPANVAEMLTAGLKPLSYRLRTELAGEAWHWNPDGSWSDQLDGRGYWTSSSEPIKPISLSYGYKLPRRGNTIDQANDDGYSRIDDGKLETLWKSNPYLDRHFTGQPASKLSQWIIVDLGNEKPVEAIRIVWANPFATAYDVQYGHFAGTDDISQALPDVWHTFLHGSIHSGRGRDVTIRLSRKPVKTRFIRILLKESSGRANRASRDVRDGLGYAVREIYIGSVNHRGVFHDELRHATNNEFQTPIYVSSTDPWHESSDKDDLIEQVGFDRIFNSHLANGLPILIPVPVVYNTPENAAAEIRYLKMRGYKIDRVELGEEPDGQFVTPEDYAALYIQFAQAVHRVDPALKIGGPSFQDIEPGEKYGNVETGKPVWLRRFLAYLKEEGRLADYTFFSFEWYPFDDVCDPTAPQLAQAATMLKNSLAEMQKGGLTRSIPWIMTEYGYSAFASRSEMDMEGALLNAEVVASFLTAGGEQTFLYGYEPNEVISEVPCTYGNNMLFAIADDGRIQRMPTYYGAQLITRQWAQPGDGWHELYVAHVLGSEEADKQVTAYAVRRPNGEWALLILNKNETVPRTVAVGFHDENSGKDFGFEGPADLYQYSRKQYELNSDRLRPFPVRDEPPQHEINNEGSRMAIILPPYSLTVVRGRTQAGVRE